MVELKPTYKESLGCVSIAEFSNERETKDGKKFMSVSVNTQKVYTDKDGVVKNTNSYSRDELKALNYLISEYLERKGSSKWV